MYNMQQPLGLARSSMALSTPHILTHRQCKARIQLAHHKPTYTAHALQIRASAAAATYHNGSNGSDRAFNLPESVFSGSLDPAQLPTTPKAATLIEVMPYLAKLALGERNLHWRLAAALVLLLTSKASGLMAPFYFKSAVDALSTVGGLSVSAAVTALLFSGACRALSALSKELQHPIFTPVSQAAGRRVSFYTLAHVLGLDMQFHLDRQTGALSRMMERGARSIAMIFRAVVFTFIPTAIELIAVCVVLAKAFDPRVSALVALTFVAYSAWTVSLTLWATRIRREVKDLDNVITARAVDALLNVEAVKLCANESLEVRRYDESLVSYQKASVKLEGTSAMLNAGQATLLAAGMTAALAAAACTKGVTPGDLVMIQGLLLQLWAPLSFLGWFYRELRQSLIDMEDLFDLLKLQTRVPEGSRQLPSSAVNQQGLKVELNNVKYRYPGTTRDVLKGVTITAEPGQSVAVVGPSGSGKSTLLRLLVRLFDVHSGAVLLDSVDTRELTYRSLRDSTAVVPQDTVLFNDTLLNNVAFGKPDASVGQVKEAIVAAKLDAALERMPHGWGTLVGERGLKLSGGEKQRVAIARAFLRRPRLLICDEATSALDSQTEKGIMASLEELAKGRTSVFVAHRLSTVQGCDKIYVLKEGKVAEQGTHASLMAARGVYYDMWQMQKAEEELEIIQAASLDGSYDEIDHNGHHGVDIHGSMSEEEAVVTGPPSSSSL